METLTHKDSGTVDSHRIKHNTRIEMILYKHKWRVKEPHFDLFENRKIPGIEIRLSDQGLQFLDKGNLFFFAYEIDAIERVLKYIGTRWDINSVKGSEIPFSVYLNIANGQAEKAA